MVLVVRCVNSAFVGNFSVLLAGKTKGRGEKREREEKERMRRKKEKTN